MKNIKRTMALTAFFIFSLCISIIGTIRAVEPTVVEVTLDPEDPAPQSTITFTAVITSEDTLEEMRLIVQECKEGLCYIGGFNESMATIDTDTYQASVTLIHDDATYIKYHLEIKSDGTWYKTDLTEFDLKVGSDNGNTTPNDTDKTPGFEIIFLLITIVFGTLVFKRKR